MWSAHFILVNYHPLLGFSASFPETLENHSISALLCLEVELGLCSGFYNTHDVVVLTFNIDYKAYTSSDLNHLKVKTLVTLRYANAKFEVTITMPGY